MHSSTESILPPALPAALPLQGQYPVIRDDAAQMCALQMQAEHGPTLAEDGAGFEAALEKYMVAGAVLSAVWSAVQPAGTHVAVLLPAACIVCTHVVPACLHACPTTCAACPPPTHCPPAAQILTSRPRQEWLTDVASRYRALSQYSKDDARIQYLRIIRSLPYGNSIFFTVKVRGRGGGCWVGRFAESCVQAGSRGSCRQLVLLGAATAGPPHPRLLPHPAALAPCPASGPLLPRSASRTPSGCCPPNSSWASTSGGCTSSAPYPRSTSTPQSCATSCSLAHPARCGAGGWIQRVGAWGGGAAVSSSCSRSARLG